MKKMLFREVTAILLLVPLLFAPAMGGTLSDFGGSFASNNGSDCLGDACTHMDFNVFENITCDPCSEPYHGHMIVAEPPPPGYYYSPPPPQVYSQGPAPVGVPAPSVLKSVVEVYYEDASEVLKGATLEYMSINEADNFGIRAAVDHFEEKLTAGGYDTLNIYAGEILFKPGADSKTFVDPALGLIGVGANFGYSGSLDMQLNISSEANLRARVLVALINDASLTDITFGYEVSIGKASMYLGYRWLASPGSEINGLQIGLKAEL